MEREDSQAGGRHGQEHAHLRKRIGQLESSESLLRATLYGIGDGVIVTDAAGAVVRMNPVAEQLTGWSEAEALGLPAHEVFCIRNEDTGQSVDSPVKRVLEEGITVGLANHTILVARDGTQRPIADSGAPVRDADGQLHGVVVVFRDQTAERQAQAREAHLKKVLLAIRDLEQVITRESDPRRLAERACFTLTGTLGYFNVWIALFGHGEKTVDVAVQSGFGSEFDAMRRQLLEKRLPACVEQAFTTRQPVVIESPEDECHPCPLTRHYETRSVFVAALEYEGKEYGCVAASVPRTFAHSEEEQQLFSSMADELAFALHRIEKDRAAQEFQRRYQEIFEGSRDGFVMVDPGGRIIDANRAFCEMLGYSLEELRRLESILEITPREWRTWERQEIWKERLLEHGYSGLYDKEFIRKDGTLIPVELQAYAVRDDRGEALYVWGITRDVTDLRKQRRERDRLLMAIEQAAEVIVITDAEGRVQYVNPAFGEVTGYTREEALGQNPRILKSGEHELAFYEELWSTISSGRTWRGQFVNRRKDGTRYTEDAVISPVCDRHGEIVHYVAVKRDITADLALEEQYRQAQKLESVGRLAGGVAHDLNNLLTPIIGYCELLIEDLRTNESAQHQLEQIWGASKRARDLVSQLLAFSRKQVMEFRALDVNEVIKEFSGLLRGTIREDVRIDLHLAPELPSVKGDSGQLEQVIMNLAANAQDAMPQGGVLSIRTEEVILDEGYAATKPGVTSGRYVMLSVSDTGVGMDRDTLDHIFEPFFTTKLKSRGTGLGLATTYGIVKQHGGNIWAYSEPGKGTSVKVYLPISEQPAEEVSDPGEQHDASLHGSETILLVEDDDQVRGLARSILERKGYRVLPAESGKAALALIDHASVPVHLLLTDVVMPGMSGTELLLRLRERQPEVKAIYMSGYADEVVSREGRPEAAEAVFLQKPFSVKSLTSAVREALDL